MVLELPRIWPQAASKSAEVANRRTLPGLQCGKLLQLQTNILLKFKYQPIIFPKFKYQPIIFPKFKYQPIIFPKFKYQPIILPVPVIDDCPHPGVKILNFVLRVILRTELVGEVSDFVWASVTTWLLALIGWCVRFIQWVFSWHFFLDHPRNLSSRVIGSSAVDRFFC